MKIEDQEKGPHKSRSRNEELATLLEKLIREPFPLSRTIDYKIKLFHMCTVILWRNVNAGAQFDKKLELYVRFMKKTKSKYQNVLRLR